MATTPQPKQPEDKQRDAELDGPEHSDITLGELAEAGVTLGELADAGPTLGEIDSLGLRGPRR